MRRAAVLLACCNCAFALNPELDISQYAHKSWTIRDGFFKGRIDAIAQTPDGYLWLGTEFGLLRFDGVQTTKWSPPGQHFASEYIRSLLVARDGTLWIGTTKELVSWRAGKFTQYQEFARRSTDRIVEDHEGSIWAGGFGASALCAIQKDGVRCYGENNEFGDGIGGLYEDAGGNLWAGVMEGLWRWKPNPPKFYPIRGQRSSVEAFAEGQNGALLLGTDKGIRQFINGKLESYPLPAATLQAVGRSLLRDRNGGLWIGIFTQGLVHLHNGKTDLFTQIDGLSGDDAYVLFEDREGSIWVATNKGLDRFRDFAVSNFSESQGVSGSYVNTALAARDGSVWLTTTDGLKRWNHGVVTAYRRRRAPPRSAQQKPGREILDSALPDDVTSLFEDKRGRIWIASAGGLGHLENERFTPVPGFPDGNVVSISEDLAGNLWISNERRGLIRLSPDGEVKQISWTSLRTDKAALSLAADPRGGIWLGFYSGGLVYFKDGQARASYSAADGLGNGQVKNLRLGREGILWAATEGGLTRVKDGHLSTLTTKNGLPCDTVHWSMEDDDRSVWLYTACGLVRVARSELDAWAETGKAIHSALFDSSDGVRTVASAGFYSPQVSKAGDGKLWFAATGDTVGVIDPRHLSLNTIQPPVQVEQIIADRKTYSADAVLKLPALTRDLEIDYTALSLVAPEKNRFRYKLEGHDGDWQDVGNRRQAYYNDLAPRNYRFRVMAANNNGVWNEAAASLEFSVAPAYYQTTWFRAAVAAGILGLLWSLYQFRMRQSVRRINIRMEERVNERTRIARDLHDTLLQSFQGSLFQFQAARNLFPRRPEDAIHNLDEAIGRAEAAIVEGRDAIQNLRAESGLRVDLAHLLTAAGKELLAAPDSNGSGAAFRLTVEGPPQTLSPVLQDEVYRIGREILRNAFRHARASRIEVEIRYEQRMLRLRIRDDGIGIDPEVLNGGARPGHWGLPGVRERAKLVGAKLDFWSEAGAGTEVQVTVPASVAYSQSGEARTFRLFRKFTRSHAN